MIKPFLHFLCFVAVVSTLLGGKPESFTVAVSGQGRPMILIPGLACPAEVWAATVAEFRRDHECHAVSIAGFGGVTAAPTDAPLLEMVREELAAYISEHKLRNPVLVGHSLGGFVVLDFAVRHPEQAGPLVLIDSLPFFAGIMRPDATLEDAKAMAEGTAGAFASMAPEAYAQMIRSGPNGSTMAAKEEDLQRIISWGLASDGATVAKAMREMYTTDLRPELARIQSPALVLAAWVGYAPYSSHGFVNRVYGEQYAGLKGVQLEISDTARHFIMLDEPRWTQEKIRTFLATAGSRSEVTR